MGYVVTDRARAEHHVILEIRQKLTNFIIRINYTAVSIYNVGETTETYVNIPYYIQFHKFAGMHSTSLCNIGAMRGSNTE